VQRGFPEFGPVLLSRILGPFRNQEGIVALFLNIAMK